MTAGLLLSLLIKSSLVAGAGLACARFLAERHAAPAILAHEMAHLRRHDWIFLVLSRLALAATGDRRLEP